MNEEKNRDDIFKQISLRWNRKNDDENPKNHKKPMDTKCVMEINVNVFKLK